MSTESHIPLHREAVDLHSQLLRCAELALEAGAVDIADFYSTMCDAITPALQRFPNAIPRSENEASASQPEANASQ